MKKILVFASDIVPLGGVATSGGGLRSWQIIKGLAGRGFDVAYCMPRHCFLRRKYASDLPEEHANRLWTDTNQDEIIQGEKPDVIVCVNPATRKWKQDYAIPVAVDFSGPNLIEYEAMAKRPDSLARFAQATAKMTNIARGDFFTCAGQRQRYYFMAFMLMAGLEADSLDIHYMPMAMPAQLPERRWDGRNKSFLFAGGFYPWLNPAAGLVDLARILDEIGDGFLNIYGGSHETNSDDKKVFEKFRDDLSEHRRVAFHGFVPWEELLERYAHAYVAFEVMPRSPERELAFTSRTVPCLWAGLPVIYNDYAELSDLISEYESGWLVPPGDYERLKETVRRVMADPDMVATRSANAQRLVREHLVYDRAIEPLARFCSNPERSNRFTGNHYLMVPSRRSGYGYVDAVYSAYRRLPPGAFAKELLRGALEVLRRKLQA